MKKTDSTQLATKADIQRLEQSTKKDIIRLEQSTKTEIQRLEKSTKADIRVLRGEFKRTEKSIRGEILRVEERGENLEDGQKRIETKVDRVLDTLDSFVGRVESLETENEVGAHQVN